MARRELEARDISVGLLALARVTGPASAMPGTEDRDALLGPEWSRPRGLSLGPARRLLWQQPVCDSGSSGTSLLLVASLSGRRADGVRSGSEVAP